MSSDLTSPTFLLRRSFRTARASAGPTTEAFCTRGERFTIAYIRRAFYCCSFEWLLSFNFYSSITHHLAVL